MAGIKTQVTCPKCCKSYEYEFVPGGSLTAVRLGNYRYMKCKKCGKWALFNITSGLPSSKMKALGNSAIIGGAGFIVMSIAILAIGAGTAILPLEIIGVMCMLISLFIIWRGVSARGAKP